LSILGSTQANPLKKVLRYRHSTLDLRPTLGRGTDHSL
jgi:hypothetical protein